MRAMAEAFASATVPWRAVKARCIPGLQPVDAAARSTAYWTASWSTFEPVATKQQPSWITSQKAAELAGAVQHIQEAAFQGKGAVAICMDNPAAVYSVLRGRAKNHLGSRKRLLRQLHHELR